MTQDELKIQLARWELFKIRAEVEKLEKEARKIDRETLLYPFVVGSGATLAIVALLNLAAA